MGKNALSKHFQVVSAPPVNAPKKRRAVLPLFFLLVIGACIVLIIESTSSRQPTSDTPPRLYSNQAQQNLRLTLVDAISEAQSSIHLVMFGLSDPAILSALSRKEIPVAVYYDPNGSPNLWSALPHVELHPVHSYGLMHQKILILDRETVFIGSANMTTASLTMHDNLVIGFKHANIARFLTENTPHSTGYMRALVGGQSVELWLLPDPRGHALQDLKRKIRAARSSLRIALFTFTHPALVEEIIAAHERGVDVRLVMDLHSGLGASHETIEKLKKAGVNVLLSKGIQLLHHKFVLIDEQTLVMGSANWTKAAFYKNSDCILVVHQLAEDQKKFMNRLWTRIASEARVLRNKETRNLFSINS